MARGMHRTSQNSNKNLLLYPDGPADGVGFRDLMAFSTLAGVMCVWLMVLFLFEGGQSGTWDTFSLVNTLQKYSFNMLLISESFFTTLLKILGFFWRFLRFQDFF